jgi:hypothetical protein
LPNNRRITNDVAPHFTYTVYGYSQDISGFTQVTGVVTTSTGCFDPSPTPTRTPTITPTPTLTPTLTPTTTNTPTPTRTITPSPSALFYNLLQSCTDSTITWYLDRNSEGGTTQLPNNRRVFNDIFPFVTYTVYGYSQDISGFTQVTGVVTTSTGCFDPSPTPTITPTPSNTPPVTPSITPTRSVPPSVTPSLTPSRTPSPTPFPTISLKLYDGGNSSELANLTCTEGQTFVFTITNGSTFCNAITLQATVIAEGLISENGFFWLADTSGVNVRLFQRNGLTDTANQAGSCQLCSTYIPSPTPTRTPSLTPTPTRSITPSITPSLTPSRTPSNTPSITPSITPSSSTPAPLPCFAVEVAHSRFPINACCDTAPTTVYFNASTVEAATAYYGTSSDCSTPFDGTRVFSVGGGLYYTWNGSSMSGPDTCPACP